MTSSVREKSGYVPSEEINVSVTCDRPMHSLCLSPTLGVTGGRQKCQEVLLARVFRMVFNTAESQGTVGRHNRECGEGRHNKELGL